MRTDRHTTTVVVGTSYARRLINNPLFVTMQQLDGQLFEVKLRKKTVSAGQPNQIGLFVYNYAKMFLLQAYYDFLDKYIPRGSFELVTCDTDSLYFALGGHSLRECVKPELLSEFDKQLPNWMPADLCPRHWAERQACRQHGMPEPLPQDCCRAHLKHQQREPGLWKVEAQADAIIALAPKCYVCYNNRDEDESIQKMSCKGVQKKLNVITPEDYYRVLQSTTPKNIMNRGLRLDANRRMRLYAQSKRGLSYLYVKRKVLDDGVSTVPLDL